MRSAMCVLRLVGVVLILSGGESQMFPRTNSPPSTSLSSQPNSNPFGSRFNNPNSNPFGSNFNKPVDSSYNYPETDPIGTNFNRPSNPFAQSSKYQNSNPFSPSSSSNRNFPISDTLSPNLSKSNYDPFDPFGPDDFMLMPVPAAINKRSHNTKNAFNKPGAINHSNPRSNTPTSKPRFNTSPSSEFDDTFSDPFSDSNKPTTSQRLFSSLSDPFGKPGPFNPPNPRSYNPTPPPTFKKTLSDPFSKPGSFNRFNPMSINPTPFDPFDPFGPDDFMLMPVPAAINKRSDNTKNAFNKPGPINPSNPRSNTPTSKPRFNTSPSSEFDDTFSDHFSDSNKPTTSQRLFSSLSDPFGKPGPFNPPNPRSYNPTPPPTFKKTSHPFSKPGSFNRFNPMSINPTTFDPFDPFGPDDVMLMPVPAAINKRSDNPFDPFNPEMPFFEDVHPPIQFPVLKKPSDTFNAKDPEMPFFEDIHPPIQFPVLNKPSDTFNAKNPVPDSKPDLSSIVSNPESRKFQKSDEGPQKVQSSGSEGLDDSVSKGKALIVPNKENATPSPSISNASGPSLTRSIENTANESSSSGDRSTSDYNDSNTKGSGDSDSNGSLPSSSEASSPTSSGLNETLSKKDPNLETSDADFKPRSAKGYDSKEFTEAFKADGPNVKGSGDLDSSDFIPSISEVASSNPSSLNENLPKRNPISETNGTDSNVQNKKGLNTFEPNESSKTSDALDPSNPNAKGSNDSKSRGTMEGISEGTSPSSLGSNENISKENPISEANIPSQKALNAFGADKYIPQTPDAFNPESSGSTPRISEAASPISSGLTQSPSKENPISETTDFDSSNAKAYDTFGKNEPISNTRVPFSPSSVNDGGSDSDKTNAKDNTSDSKSSKLSNTEAVSSNSPDLKKNTPDENSTSNRTSGYNGDSSLKNTDDVPGTNNSNYSISNATNLNSSTNENPSEINPTSDDSSRSNSDSSSSKTDTSDINGSIPNDSEAARPNSSKLHESPSNENKGFDKVTGPDSDNSSARASDSPGKNGSGSSASDLVNIKPTGSIGNVSDKSLISNSSDASTNPLASSDRISDINSSSNSPGTNGSGTSGSDVANTSTSGSSGSISDKNISSDPSSINDSSSSNISSSGSNDSISDKKSSDDISTANGTITNISEPSTGTSQSDKSVPLQMVGRTANFSRRRVVRRRLRKSSKVVKIPKNPLGDFKIICLFNNKKFYRSGFSPAMIDPGMCTHVNYEFAILDPKTHELITGNTELDVERNFFQEAINLKKIKPDLKVMLSLGGWDDSTKKYSEMASNPAKRANFVAKAVNFIKTHEFDGMDLAWEYPNCWQGAIGISWKDKNNFVLLLQDLKKRFKAENPKLELSVSVGAIKREVEAAYDVPKISAAVDHINVMTYDMHGPWESTTGHHTQFEARPGDTDRYCNTKGGLQVWIDKGADKKKLHMGIALYGKSFKLADPRRCGIGAPAKGIGNPGPVSKNGGLLLYSEICEFLNSGNWTEGEDKHAGYYAYNKDQWTCYDPPMMMVKKAKYVVEQGLGGVLLKDLSGDDFKGTCFNMPFPLTKMMRMEMIQKIKKLGKKG